MRYLQFLEGSQILNPCRKFTIEIVILQMPVKHAARVSRGKDEPNPNPNFEKTMREWVR